MGNAFQHGPTDPRPPCGRIAPLDPVIRQQGAVSSPSPFLLAPRDDARVADDVERAFDAAMVAIYKTANRDLGYNATRFLQMITDEGGHVAATKLLRAPAASDGFTTLWEHGRLDLSVEAHVLRPEFAELFTERERRIARKRLQDYGFEGDLGNVAGPD